LKPRTLVLIAGCFVLATGLLIAIVPKSVQTGNPILGQVGGGTTGSFSCGSALQYAFGHSPWEDADPETYVGNQFTTVSQVCPPTLRSNLRSAIVWVLVGAAILVARWYVLRRNQRHRQELRRATSGP
jgi:hypothetical protein